MKATATSGSQRTYTRRFLVRLLLSLGLTLGLLGALQYAMVERMLTDRVQEQAVAVHSADAAVLASLFIDDAPTQEGRLADVVSLLGHMAVRPGIDFVGLHDSDAHLLIDGSTAGDHGGGEHQPAQQGEAQNPGTQHMGAPDGADGAPHVETDTGHGGNTALTTPGASSGQVPGSGEVSRVAAAMAPSARSTGGDTTQVLIPMELGGDVFVLHVDRSDGLVEAHLADMRRLVGLSLLAGLALVVPLFYLLGAKRLADTHGAAMVGSTTDGLTGLRNHRRFQEEIRAAVDGARDDSTPLSLMIVDLDGFKQVNDMLGHQHGDVVLVAVAEVLRAEAGAERSFRLGGDEFAAVLGGMDPVEATALAGRVRATIDSEIVGVTASIGLAQLGVRAPDAPTLVAAADAAMYAVKGRSVPGNAVYADCDTGVRPA